MTEQGKQEQRWLQVKFSLSSGTLLLSPPFHPKKTVSRNGKKRENVETLEGWGGGRNWCRITLKIAKLLNLVFCACVSVSQLHWLTVLPCFVATRILVFTGTLQIGPYTSKFYISVTDRRQLVIWTCARDQGPKLVIVRLRKISYEFRNCFRFVWLQSKMD